MNPIVPAPCPDCESNRHLHVEGVEGACYLECKSCGKKGPEAATIEAAIRAWNKSVGPVDPSTEPS